MKNLKFTLCLAIFVAFNAFAQQENNQAFLLSPQAVKIYDFEASTKGVHYEYQFEDDYTVKLTNKAYKISLFFPKGKIETVQKVVANVLEGNNTSSGFTSMIWKKTNQDGKAKYKIEVKDDKLRIEIIRKNSDAEVYETLNKLGQEFIKAINS